MFNDYSRRLPSSRVRPTRHLSLLVVFGVISLASCTSDGARSLEPSELPNFVELAKRGGNPPGKGWQPVDVSVTPARALLAPSAEQQFVAKQTLKNGTVVDAAVTWKVTGGGSITSNGLYQAPATPGSSRVIAVLTAGDSDTAAVSIAEPSSGATVASVVLTPASATLTTGGTQSYTASAVMSDGSTGPVNLTYKAGGGTITSAGLYTAGNTPGKYAVIGTSAEGKADTVSVTVEAPAATLASLVLTPATTSLAAGASQQFAVSGRLSDGTSAAVSATYSATGGTISASGLYTAGSAAGAYRVIATDSSGSLRDTASITITSSAPQSTTGEQAAAADSFVNSIGVNVHLFYGNVYSTGYSTIVKPRLAEIGIRHLRDHALSTADWNTPKLTQKLQELAAAGTKSLLIIDERYCTPISNCLAMVKGAGPQTVVEAVEGPNEPDIRLSNGGTTWDWMPAMKQYMQDTWNAFKGDPATAGLPIGSPTFWMSQTPSYLGDVSGRVNFGSVHPYPAWPNYPTYVDEFTNHRKRYTPDYGSSKPFYASETGYHTGAPGSDRPISEAKHAKYMPRLLLEYFNRGAARSYIYELVDQGTDGGRESSFGLVRNNGTVKPAFTAIKNLIGLLEEPGARFQPGRLDYTLSGSTSNVHHTLLQKLDGRFYLVLWLEVQSSDGPTSQGVTVNFGAPVSVTRYQPSQGMGGTSMGASVTNVNLQVPDEPVILEITR